MTLQLDHVVIAVHDLDAAIQNYRALGFTVRRGGVHANGATHNALITFANGTYLELLAATHETPVSGLVDFSAMLQHGEGLAGFALRSDDLATEAARLRSNGFAVDDVIPGERRRADGTLVQWKLALLDGGFAPFLIQDVTPRERRIPDVPAVTTHPNRAMGLRAVEIAVRDLAAAWDRYTRLFGITLTSEAEQTRPVEAIVLVETSDTAAPDRLDALHLILDSDALDQDQTHGVRFVTVAP